MLDLAIKYREILNQKMYDTWFEEKYKYYHFSPYYLSFDIQDNTYDKHDFVSIKGSDVIGYICYEINRLSNCCYGLGIINFSNDKITFGCDLKQAIEDIFEKFNFNKLKFSVVIGNPIEKNYDKIVQKYGGRIVGIHREDIRLMDGKLYDVKNYEILKSDYSRLNITL